MGLSALDEAIKQKLEDDFERAYGPREDKILDSGWIEQSYPSERMLSVDAFLTAEEAAAQEEQLLGKRGVPEESPLLQPLQSSFLDDEIPEFLQNAAKAGPVRKKPSENKFPEEATPSPAILMSPSNDGKNTIKIPERTTTLTKDHELEYPDLYLAVHVQYDWEVGQRDDEARYARWLSRTGCYRAESLDAADLVIFSGGSDVDPHLYGETPHPKTCYDEGRDNSDMEAYLRCRELGIPMLGICRGAQFLHVMNGGKLYQDIDKHYGGHRVNFYKDKLMIDNVSSSHHQACVFDSSLGMELLGFTSQSETRWLNAKDKEEKKKPDVEAFFYRDTGCLGFQGHPEYQGYNRFSVYVAEKINDMFLTSPDYTWNPKRLRMTPEAKDAKVIAAQYIEQAYSSAKEA